jgi:hypothetical protein
MGGQAMRPGEAAGLIALGIIAIVLLGAFGLGYIVGRLVA